jgi:hypothetical protein
VFAFFGDLDEVKKFGDYGNNLICIHKVEG